MERAMFSVMCSGERLASPEICRQKSRECLALAEMQTEPKQKAAMLQYADWWSSLAEYGCYSVSVIFPIVSFVGKG